MKKIDSISKAKLSTVQRLLQKKYRVQTKKFLVEGARNVEEAISSNWTVEMVLVTPEFHYDQTHGSLLDRAAAKHILLHQIRPNDFRKISDTVHTQGIVAVVHQKSYDPELFDSLGTNSIVVALDGLGEPGNVGTIIRTCDWFGVDAVLVGRDSVEVFNPKVVRSAMGSIFHLPIMVDVDLREELKKLKNVGFHIFATSADDGESIDRLRLEGKTIIVFGNEAHGVSETVRQVVGGKIQIPRFGSAESLNVGIACGVVLASLRLHSTREVS